MNRMKKRLLLFCISIEILLIVCIIVANLNPIPVF